MKQLFFVTCLFVLSFPILASAAEPVWNMEQGRTWSRDPGAITSRFESDSGETHLRYTGNEDWAYSNGNRIPVKPGEIYELSAKVKFSSKDGSTQISLVTRDAKEEVLAWSYGATEIRDSAEKTVTLKSRFLTTHGIATIEPRLIGYRSGEIALSDFQLKRTGALSLPDPSQSLEIQNDFLTLRFRGDSALFSVEDRRTGRVWEQSDEGLNDWVLLSLQKAETPGEFAGKVKLKLLQASRLRELDVSLNLETRSSEFTLEIDSEKRSPMPESIPYPYPFATKIGDRVILPVNEGIGFPVEESAPGLGNLIAYGGHGISMPFWGVCEDRSGAGMMGIFETADDAEISVRTARNRLLHLRPNWVASSGTFRYKRVLRYVFLERGGHVAMCKRYRNYAKETGLWTPFTEKRKKNPNIDKLIGAANIWSWDSGKIETIKELKSVGIERILWSGGGSAKQIAEMNAMDKVLTSRYDIYQDVMDPAKFDQVRSVHGDWTSEAWPQDVNWTSPDGTWRKGWEVAAKEPGAPRIPCAVICDSKALPYARKRIAEELTRIPYKARFLDTTVASPWFECYHPDHPMSRSESKFHKMELLRIVGEEFSLVCGSETGHDASVPYCDFYEGMMSLGPWRIHEAGRNMIQLVEEVPPQIAKYQLGEAYRLPLWELVYHDCTVSYWYWGDYNNKLPAVWKKRDLFNALYGVPPMYMFTRDYWNANKECFAESYKIAQPVSRLTGYCEMLDHRILSEDRKVQQTVFANGVEVYVNFGETPFTLPDGETLEGGGLRIVD